MLFVTAAVAAAVFSPSGWKQAEEHRALDESGVRTTGTVVSHHVRVSRRNCGRSAVIAYSVAGLDHTVSVFGCGASASDLPLGRDVDVVYVADRPEIADASVPGASASRVSAGALLLLWAGVLLIGLLASRAWTKEAARHAP